MTNELTTSQEQPGVPAAVADVTGNLVLVARDAGEMARSQQSLSGWFRAKEQLVAREVRDLEMCVEEGERSKMNVAPLKKLLKQAEGRRQFYERCAIANENGFCVVPNMPGEIFAIRTERKRPIGHDTRRDWIPAAPPQGPTRSPAGEGEYVSPIPSEDVRSRDAKDAAGNPVTVFTTWADDWQEVEFPISVAKPEIMSETARAMALKVFDELVIVQGTEAEQSTARRRNITRRGDPIVLGVCHLREKSRLHQVSFLIGWYLDTRTLP